MRSSEEKSTARVERILIAGAGIGGLTAGIALVRAGFNVVVVERAPAPGAVGAGITVQANAVAALRRLGLDTAVRAAGMAMGRSEIRRSDGKVLASVALDRLEPVLGAPSVAIHRARLQQLLLDELGAGRVRAGAEAVGFEESEKGVTLLLGDGSRLEGSAMVGADGLRSRLRAALHGETEPVYAGYTSWRGVAHHGGRVSDGYATEMWGPRRVTLLGDAAHPMTPNLGQGGCQAIEDAVVLGKCLARATDVETGLRAYETERAARASFFVKQSRSVGRVAQASGRIACAVRNTAFRMLPRAALERQIVSAQRFEG